jgi:hypothetical protein
VNFKQLLVTIAESGIKLPHAYDPALKQPSFRLLTAYSSFILAFSSIIALHFHPEVLAATGTAIAFFGLNMVFYMLKKLQNAKIDLDDKEISLSSEKEVDNN